ncbi:hypothetical protein [Streptomyces niveus]|uniref:hypothetical protein n=1 Tax=Streptomyces niveus TaxID=193462 RepID=UPI0036B04DDC
MATSPSSRLIAAAVRERLRPLGLRQRGRSRVWIDDQGWWLGGVELPSPRWSQGSGLVVGVMWLWQDADHLSLDFVERVPSEAFRHEAQFTDVATVLAQEAERRIESLRGRFTDLDQVADGLLQRPDRRGYLWESFNAGVAAALVGRSEEARLRLGSVLDEDPLAPWIEEAQEVARHVHSMADDPVAVRRWAAAAIISCRAKLALAEPPAPLNS